MFGSLGMPELIMIFVIALLLFGPRKLPEIGRSIGKAMGEFRRATNDLKSSIEEEVRLEEQKSTTPAVEPMRPLPVGGDLSTVPRESVTTEPAVTEPTVEPRPAVTSD